MPTNNSIRSRKENKERRKRKKEVRSVLKHLKIQRINSEEKATIFAKRNQSVSEVRRGTRLFYMIQEVLYGAVSTEIRKEIIKLSLFTYVIMVYLENSK